MNIPWNEYPRPQFVRKEWMNLNGIWQFSIESPKFNKKILVPFCPESKLSGIEHKDFMKQIWYRKCFSLPKKWNKKRIFLHFGAVDYLTRVWLNDKLLGEHTGGYTPFSFEITDFVKSGKNELKLQVKDNLLSGLQPCGKQSGRRESYECWYTRTTGIWQTVWLEAVPETFIKLLHITPDLDEKKVTIWINLDSNNLKRGNNCHISIRAEGLEIVKKKIKIVGKDACTIVELPEVKPWTLEKPFLYDLEVILKNIKGKSDKVRSYFGVRKIHTADKKVFLNNKPVFQRLVLDQGYYPDGIYTAPDDKSLKKDIEIAKKLGFNGARLHQKVFEPRFLYWADKLGYLVWSEFPSWGFDTSRPTALEIFLKEWSEVLKRDYNHPSIIGWCPFNETSQKDNPQVISAVARITKLIDPTRPIIDTSGFIHVYPRTDIYDCHTYEQDVNKFVSLFEKFKTTEEVFHNFDETPYKGQPYFVSEYGGIWWNHNRKDRKSWGYGERPDTKDEFIKRYKGLTETLLFHPKISGFCYTQLYDVEQETNGLYTYERKTKFDLKIFYKINSQKAKVEK